MWNRRVRVWSSLIFGAAVFFSALPAFAAPGVPRILNYQGRLLSSGGALLGGSGTEYCFRFSFYDDQTVGSGTKLWPSGAPSTMTATVRSGVFTLGIGDTTIGGDTLDFNFQDTDTAYLNVEVASKVGATCAPGDGAESFETFSPRQRILASGYAINASMVGGFSALQHASGNQIPVLSSGNLILGGTDPILSATTTNTLTLQGSSSGDLRFFGSSNRITATGNAIFAGEVSATGASTTYATTTTLVAGSASTSNLTVSNGFTFGTLTGILRASAGAVTTSLINLASDVTGILGISNGGTGTSTAPSYGQVLLGNALGGYDLVATSSLGITGGGGGTWGSITGTLSDQTDLQAALDARLTLTDWYATTTDGLDEGPTNRYYTDDRVNTFVAGSTTIAKTYAANVFTTLNEFRGGLFASSSVLFGNTGVSSLLFDSTTGRLGLGTTSPFAKLSVQAFDGDGVTSLFTVASSSGGTTRNLFSVDRNGVTTVGDASGSGDATFQFGSDTNAWSMGFNAVDKSFRIASSTNLSTDVVLSIAKTGVATFNTGAALPAIANCTQALETDVSGNIVCGTDVSGGGGGAGAWATTTDDLAIYVADPSDVVLIGATATTTTGNVLEIAGNTLMRGSVTAYDTVTLPRLVATSSVASVLPYASTTAISASYASSTQGFFGSISIGTLTGILRASAGAVTTSLINLASDVTGILGISNGGTGTSTAPSYGQVLLGNALGGYDLVATSSLGITGGGGGTWGSITGTLSDQTDLQAALDARLTLTDWYATTTDGLDEGPTNRYYTDDRVNTFVAGSTTIAKTYGDNTFTGLTTLANASTTALSASYASSTQGFFGSLSIGNLTGVLKAAVGSVTTALLDLASEVTGVLGVSNGGTGTSTAPVSGQLLLGNNLGGYDLVGTSSLAINIGDTTGVLDESRGGTGQNDYVLGDILYASGAGTLSRLPIGSAGQVLKVTGGIPTWGVDLTSGGGGGGGSGYFSTTTDELAIYPTNTSHVVLIGTNATATQNSIFEVSGRSYFSNVVGIGTTSPGSILSIGNVANFDAGGSTLYTSLSVPSLSVGSLTGVLKASAGAVTAALIDLATDVSGILQVANGGTGWAEIESGTLLTGNGAGAVATTTVGSSLQLLGGTLSLNTANANIWSAQQTFSFASSSVFSAGRAYFGQTATTTIDTAGNVAVAGTLEVSGNTTLSAATTTNLMVTASSTFQDFTSRNATSSLLYVSSALRGAGLSGCDTAGDKLLWNSLTGQFSCGTDVGGSPAISSLGAAGQLQTGATQTFASSSDANLGITITSAGDQHTFAMNWLGTLAVSRGGTGWGNIESGTLLTGNGTDALATTSVGSSLQLAGATLGLNLANANIWSGLQRFGSGASTTALSANDFLTVGRTATTTIRGEANATSTFAGGVDATRVNTSATSTLAGVRLTNLTSCAEALETDASGNVVCGNDAGVDGVTVTTFTADGTWTKSNYSGLSFTQVITTAGGGGGGGSDGFDTASEQAGGGGGAGGTAIEMIPAASLGATESVIVDTSGGAGGSNAGGNGVAGGNASFGSHNSATGGSPGTGGTDAVGGTCAIAQMGAGGAGAGATGGDINLSGGGGTAPPECLAEEAEGGVGGGSYWGGGGKGGIATAAGSTAGQSGAYGSGGGGAAAVDTTTGAVGGDGADGIVVTMNYTSSGADLAEWYETQADVQAGDVVAISSNTYEYDSKLGLQKSAILEKATPNSSVVGVVSTAPFETMGYDLFGKAIHPQPIALAGRVPVKVTEENGTVMAGDLLTVSSQPGRAMRSTKAGATIGRALEDAVCTDGEECTVLIMVNTSYTTGALINKAFEGVGIDSEAVPEGLDFARMILAEMLQQKRDITTSSTLSEISTDRLAAGLEIITPRVITDTIVVGAIEPVEKDVRMRLTDEGKFILERVSEDSMSVAFVSASSTATSSLALSIDALGNSVFAGAITGAELIVGSSEKPGGITMYDSDTGEPYCARIVYGKLETFAGTCADVAGLFEAEPEEEPAYVPSASPPKIDNVSDTPDVEVASEPVDTETMPETESDTVTTDEPAPTTVEAGAESDAAPIVSPEPEPPAPAAEPAPDTAASE